MKNNGNFTRRFRHSLRRKKNIMLLSCIAAALLCMISVVIFVIVLKHNSDSNITISEIPEAEEIPPPETEEPTEEEPEAPVVYPEPDYNLTLEEIYVPLEGLQREYRVAWVSDLHLITDHEPGGVSEGSIIKLNSRYETLAVTEDGVHAEELWPDIIKCLNVGNYDALIFGGDMMDYCSPSNMDALKKGYDELRYDK